MVKMKRETVRFFFCPNNKYVVPICEREHASMSLFSPVSDGHARTSDGLVTPYVDALMGKPLGYFLNACERITTLRLSAGNTCA